MIERIVEIGFGRWSDPCLSMIGGAECAAPREREDIRAIGCDISFLDLSFDQGFKLDIEALSVLLRPETKLISITCPHNPTGVMLTGWLGLR